MVRESPGSGDSLRILVLAPHDFYIDRGTPMDVDILVRALSARGYAMDLVTYRAGEDRDYPGLAIHRASTPVWMRPNGPGFSFRKLLSTVGVFLAARRLVKRHEYDVVHAGEEAVFLAIWFGWWKRLPYVYDMDSSVAQQLVEKMPWLRPLSPVFDWFERRAIRGALAVAPVCGALADLARDRGAAHVVTLHDISQLRPVDGRGSGWLKQRLDIDAPVIMYVGNLQPYQGVDLLLEAFAVALRRGCEAHLVVAGGSEDSIRSYQRRVESLGVDQRVHFLGHWPAARLAELLAEADVVTSPRTTGVNTPMKIFPYLHSGRALLATHLPTHNQILTPDVARLAPADAEEFAEAIIELIADEELRERLGRAGRAFVERNHVFDAHQRRVDALYEYVEAGIQPSLRRTDDAHSSNGRNGLHGKPSGEAGTA